MGIYLVQVWLIPAMLGLTCGCTQQPRVTPPLPRPTVQRLFEGLSASQPNLEGTIINGAYLNSAGSLTLVGSRVSNGYDFDPIVADVANGIAVVRVFQVTGLVPAFRAGVAVDGHEWVVGNSAKGMDIDHVLYVAHRRGVDGAWQLLALRTGVWAYDAVQAGNMALAVGMKERKDTEGATVAVVPGVLIFNEEGNTDPEWLQADAQEGTLKAAASAGTTVVAVGGSWVSPDGLVAVFDAVRHGFSIVRRVTAGEYGGMLTSVDRVGSKWVAFGYIHGKSQEPADVLVQGLWRVVLDDAGAAVRSDVIPMKQTLEPKCAIRRGATEFGLFVSVAARSTSDARSRQRVGSDLGCRMIAWSMDAASPGPFQDVGAGICSGCSDFGSGKAVFGSGDPGANGGPGAGWAKYYPH